MDDLKAELQQLGWYLSNKGLEICKTELGGNNSKIPSKEISNYALNIDLNEIGDKALPDDLNKGKLNEISGPLVLQVMKVRNAAAPKANEESSVAPRLLQLQLSDGHKSLLAIEHNSFGKEISLNTPPGSKVRLDGTMKFRNGFLLLDFKNIRLLGGQVESLYNKWKSAKDAAGFFRNVTEGDESPPPFVPFGKKIDYRCDTSNPSLQSSNTKGDACSDNKGFNEQRESAIAKVEQSMGDSAGKPFATSRKSELMNQTNQRKSETDSTNQFRKSEERQNFRSFSDTQNGNLNYKKTGSARADEGKLDQICQMGFSRSAAIGALRRYNNNLDDALEALLSTEQKGSASRSDDPKAGRRNTRGGRGGRRFGRGGKANFTENDNSHQTSSATLLDYLPNKMTSNTRKDKSIEDVPSTSSSAAPSQAPYTADDDALQEECLVQYAKEISLVEMHGEARTSQQQQQQNESPEINPENRGVNKYRTGGNKASSNSRNDCGFDERRDNRSYQPNRTRQDRTRFDRNSNRNSEDESSFNRNDEAKSVFDRNSNRNRPVETTSDRFSNSKYKQNSDRRRRNDSRFDNYSQQNSYDHRNRTNRKDYQDEGRYDEYNRSSRNDAFAEPRRTLSKSYPKPDVPPRFRKQAQDNSNPRRQFEQNQESRKGLTLGETNRQMQCEENVSPVLSEERYPIYASDGSQERSRVSTSHSYQDQRQQSRGENGRKAPNSTDNRNESQFHDDNETVWKPGMTCQAIYWEDEQYYKATVLDVHPVQPTAVVQFIGYGNSEEVLFKDMRPLKNQIKPHLPDHGSYNGPTDGLEFTRGHKGPTRYPRERERRTNQKPSKTLYQPPIPH